MFQPNHKLYIKALYKNILVESSLFFDDRARYLSSGDFLKCTDIVKNRLYIRNRARKVAQEYKTCTDVDRVKYKIREARKVIQNNMNRNMY